MKHILILMLTLAVLLGGYPVAAQQTNNDDVYVVQPGDSAWRVAGKVMDDPTLWQEVVKKNPFLNEKGRITFDRKTGWIKVMMHPGEKLVGLGITEPAPSETTFLPQSATTVRWSEVGLDRLVWTLLALVFLFLFIFWYVLLRSRRDPVSSGPAIVPEGVAPENAPARFQEMAARLNANRTGLELSGQNFQIISSQGGCIWGVLNVRYANGQEIPRQLNGNRAYRAEVRFPDGKTETLYMLRGCGNDLRYGGISRYLPGPDFRFEADPEPVVVPPPIVPAEQPAVSQESTATGGVQPNGEFVREKDAPVAAVVNEPSVVRFEIRKSTDAQPAMVRITGINEGEDTTVEIKPGEVTFRYHVSTATAKN